MTLKPTYNEIAEGFSNNLWNPLSAVYTATGDVSGGLPSIPGFLYGLPGSGGCRLDNGYGVTIPQRKAVFFGVYTGYPLDYRPAVTYAAQIFGEASSSNLRINPMLGWCNIPVSGLQPFVVEPLAYLGHATSLQTDYYSCRSAGYARLSPSLKMGDTESGGVLCHGFLFHNYSATDVVVRNIRGSFDLNLWVDPDYELSLA